MRYAVITAGQPRPHGRVLAVLTLPPRKTGEAVHKVERFEVFLVLLVDRLAVFWFRHGLSRLVDIAAAVPARILLV